MSEVERHYIRCAQCLSIGCIDGPYTKGWHCGICAGDIEHMGKVVQNHLETEHEKSACDKRCTHAIGPLCVCKCNCANHGTGRTVVVVVREDIPVIDFTHDDKALGYAQAYSAFLVGAMSGLNHLDARKKDNSIPYAERRPLWSTYYYAQKALRKVREARTIKARNSRMEAFHKLLSGL